MSREEVSRSEVAEWEEPRHPGPASHQQRTPLCPTLQHGTRVATPIADIWSLCGPERPANDRVPDVRALAPSTQGDVQTRRLHAEVHVTGHEWSGVGGIRPPAACGASLSGPRTRGAA